MESSTFGDKARIPTDGDLEAALGPTGRLWISLIETLSDELPPLTGRWGFAGKAYGWSYGLRRRDRAVVYLTPLDGRFRASLAIPERAMPAALAADAPGADPRGRGLGRGLPGGSRRPFRGRVG